MARKYNTTAGDQWDKIARTAYGAKGEMLMHLLLETNPAYRETVIFDSSIELLIPDAPESQATSLPPWMRT